MSDLGPCEIADDPDKRPCPRCGKTWLNGTCDDTVSRRSMCLGAASLSDSTETP